MSEVIRGDIEDGDRELTPAEVSRLAEKGNLAMGNGSWPSFKDLPAKTLREYQERSVMRKRLNREVKKLAELQAYMDAHREHALEILGAKVNIIEGLLAEMQVINQTTGEVVFDTRVLPADRLKILLTAIDQFERRAYGNPVNKTEQSGSVDVVHKVAAIKESLTKGD